VDPGLRRRLLPVSAAIASDAIAGILLLALTEDPVADFAGIVLLGTAFVALVAWVFFEVGRSEDVEREREPPRGR
jgi:ABC-type cobalamin transport system permease subunit